VTCCFECRQPIHPLERVNTWLEEAHDKGLERVFVHADCRQAQARVIAAGVILPAVRIAAGLVGAAKARAA
jgi:hypothetical protein